MNSQRDHSSERGIVLVSIFMTLLPLMALVATAVSLLETRSDDSSAAIAREKAFLAAESGVDGVLFLANSGKLDHDTPVTGTLASGADFYAETKELEVDGVDNDQDGQTDEEDEDVIEVSVLGTYARTQRRLVCYMRELDGTASVPESAVSVQDPFATISISGSSFVITGNDTNTDGSPGPKPAVPGLAILAPADPQNTINGLKKNQKPKVSGAGGAPSVHQTTTIVDIPGTIATMKGYADNVVPAGHYTSLANFGDASTGAWRSTYVPGDLEISGNLHGAGILLVDGNLTMSGASNFYGLVVVGGTATFQGGGSGKMLRGALVLGGDLSVNGTIDINYSYETVSEAQLAVASRYVITGWREHGVGNGGAKTGGADLADLANDE